VDKNKKFPVPAKGKGEAIYLSQRTRDMLARGEERRKKQAAKAAKAEKGAK